MSEMTESLRLCALSPSVRRRLLMCLVWRSPVVARSGKWAVSAVEYHRPRYPTYCCGLGYLLTGDVASLLLSAAASDCLPVGI